MSTKLVEELERRMTALNLDAKTVSVRAGLGSTFIRDIQRGKSREPKRSAIEKIARVLGCSVQDLMGEPAPPTDKQLEEALLDLHTESDMTAAVVGGSLLEAALELLLRARLLQTSEQLVRDLFGDKGPLADLRSKILIAQAFGLVTSSMARELQDLQEIRNIFAHSREPVTFDQPSIEEKVFGLRMIKAIREKEAALAPDGPQLSTSAKTLYLTVIRILQIIFDATRKHGGTADAALEQVLSKESALKVAPPKKKQRESSP